MTDAELPQQPEGFALWREIQDTRIRTRLGGLYYLLAWLLSWLFSATPLQYLGVGLAGTLFFALMMAGRIAHVPPKNGSELELLGWLNRHWTLILATCLAWGLAHAWLLLNLDSKDPKAAEARKFNGQDMTQKQLAAAEKRSSEILADLQVEQQRVDAGEPYLP
eukprot:gene6872-8543_t